jgi:hypothetical protein
MTSIKSYKITSQAQLIDLNGESTNFDIHFHVQSDNKEPFEISVVDQQKLDSGTNIDFQNANEGVLSGNLNATDNIYQNYYLALKATKDCNVQVKLDKKELPIESQNQGQMQPEQMQPEQMQQGQMQQGHMQQGQMQQGQGNFFTNNWKFILVIVVCVLCLGLWYYFSKKNTNKDNLNTLVSDTTVVQPDSISPIASSTGESTPKMQTPPVYNSDILSRLNKLNI